METDQLTTTDVASLAGVTVASIRDDGTIDYSDLRQSGWRFES